MSLIADIDGEMFGEDSPTSVFAHMNDPWDHPRTTAGIAIMCDWADAHGCALGSLLDGTGLSPDDLRDTDRLVEAQQEIAVIRNLLAAFDASAGLGAQIGREYHLTSYGYYGYLLQSCSVVSEMVRAGLRYSPLTFAFATFSGELIADDRWSLWVLTDGVPDDIATFVTERDLSASMQMQRELFAGQDVDPLIEVHFAHDVDSDDARTIYADVFGVPVRFGCDRSELIFERGYLDLPLPMGNPHTMSVITEHCERLREERLHSHGVAGQVRAYLLEQRSLDRTLDECATDLHYSTRTLRRGLTREGTSYRAIHDDVRRGLAHDLLRDPSIPRARVAERLGYRDWSSFTRAMRRWGRIVE
ncbi:AraC family transcriptional regulator [Gordonia sp. CPCC 205515]|uniref:AraC family transcriptional regulator n=1 Tax=Gordonia sp. CPCC 205515 TaxID=3140791 RepID=UPI003AF3CC8C